MDDEDKKRVKKIVLRAITGREEELDELLAEGLDDDDLADRLEGLNLGESAIWRFFDVVV